MQKQGDGDGRNSPPSWMLFRSGTQKMNKGKLFAFSAMTLASAQVLATEVYSQSRFVMGEITTGGVIYRPLKMSIYDSKAVIASIPSNASSRIKVYLYDYSGGTPSLMEISDGDGQVSGNLTFNQQFSYGYHHYKDGYVGINDDYLCYISDSQGERRVRCRSLQNLNSVVDLNRDSAKNYESHYYALSPDNRSATGFGYRGGGADIGYRSWFRTITATGALGPVVVLESAYGNTPTTCPVPIWGTQTFGQTVAWMTGPHNCSPELRTIKFRTLNANNTLGALKSLTVPAGVAPPAQYAFYGDKFVTNSFCHPLYPCESSVQELGIYRLNADGSAPTYTPVEGTGPVVGLSPELYGNTLLYTTPEGIFKRDISNPSKLPPPIQLTKVSNVIPGNEYAHSGARLSANGTFVYFSMTPNDPVRNGQAADNMEVYLSSIWRSDANLDGAVNDQDFNLLKSAYLNGYVSSVDFDHDGKITFSDWNVLAEEWGAHGVDIGPNGQRPPYFNAAHKFVYEGLGPVLTLILD